jgi:ABC-type branched-subunit amino acid transport system ATPase component
VDITRYPVHRRARLGIGRTFQRIELFGGMSVRDHLLVAERTRLGTGRFWKDCLNLAQPSADERERADRALELLGLDDVADRPVESLSLGRGRLVELGRALMTEPLLLLLDEPSSGLDQHETQDLVRTLHDIRRERGTAILLVEHDVEMVRAFAERLYVLDFGTLIAQGATSEVMADEAVRKAYLGEIASQGDIAAAGEAGAGATAAAEDRPAVSAGATGAGATGTSSTVAPLLELRGVEAGYGPFRALFGVSFSVDAGKVVALLGANGAGKTTIARLVSGLIPITAGKVLLDGVDISGMKPWRIAPLGIVQAPEGRSVFGTLTVEENLTLDFRRNLGRRGVRAGLERAFELFPRLGERRKQVAGTLSGGEQRMLSLARVLVRPPRLLVVDELSLGLAPIIIDEVYATLEQVRQEGTTLLLIEQYVGHALRIADSVVLLQHGEVVYDGSAGELGDIAERLLSTSRG